MTSVFLPESASGEYPFDRNNPRNFTAQTRDQLGNLGRMMKVGQAASEGRVPSPYSRAYMFYKHLFTRGLAPAPTGGGDAADQPDERGDLVDYRKAARQTFRGLCAAIALRKVTGLDLRPNSKNPGASDNPIGKILDSCRNSAPGGPAFWQSLRFLEIHYRGGDTEVLAGLSPLTGFFPAGSPPRRLQSLFWYLPAQNDETGLWDRNTGRWFDPTQDFEPGNPVGGVLVAPATVRQVKILLRVWLEAVLDGNRSQRCTLESLKRFGFDQDDAILFRKELEVWLVELRRATGMMEDAQKLAEVEGAASQLDEDELPIWNWVAIWKQGVAQVLSDLPVRNGRMLLDASLLADNNVRIIGRQMGSRKLAEKIVTIPRSGDRLGDHLGLLGEASVPFVNVDRLFTPLLASITQGLEVAEDWGVLKLRKGKDTESFLFPFEREVLEIIKPAEIAEAASVSGSSISGFEVKLNIQADGRTLTVAKTYRLNSTEAGGKVDNVIGADTLDLRVFPNFDLGVRYRSGTGQDEEWLVPHAEDRVYHLRIRHSPFWQFKIVALLSDGGVPRPQITEEVAWDGKPKSEDQIRVEDCATFLEVAAPKKPIGFEFADRGMVLVKLAQPNNSGRDRLTEWEVAVDFGTSNTCVAHRIKGWAAGNNPKVLRLPVLTTALFLKPNYVAPLGGGLDEAGAAAVDFFPVFPRENDKALTTSEDYFSTQFLTGLPHRPIAATTLQRENGQIYFRSLASAPIYLNRILKDFPDLERGGDQDRRFDVRTGFKWDDTHWRKPFLQVLRRLINLTAASENGRVTKAFFSYPGALQWKELIDFKADVQQVWGDELATEGPFLTESEAVNNLTWADDENGGKQNEYVLFDLGGGTADLLAITTAGPLLQSSIRFAAGALNDYFCDSTALRDRFVDVLAKKYELERQLLRGITDPRSNKGFLTLAWLELLQKTERLDPSIWTVLREKPRGTKPDAPLLRSVRGFCLSTVVWIGGLAFHAGRLFQVGLVQAGGQLPLYRTCLRLLGNGSKLARAINPDGDMFTKVFEGLFRSGFEHEAALLAARRSEAGLAPAPVQVLPQVVFQGMANVGPKAVIALGALQGSDTVATCAHPPTVGLPGDAHELAQPALGQPGQPVPADVAAFLKELDRHLIASGRAGDILPFVSAAPGFKPGRALSVEAELLATFEEGRPEVHRFEREVADQYQRLQGESATDALGKLEPLFIARLRGLQKGIFMRYGK